MLVRLQQGKGRLQVQLQGPSALELQCSRVEVLRGVEGSCSLCGMPGCLCVILAVAVR